MEVVVDVSRVGVHAAPEGRQAAEPRLEASLHVLTTQPDTIHGTKRLAKSAQGLLLVLLNKRTLLESDCATK